jgi:glycosyltransferase involved in cell wall biosynthesis
LKLAVLAAADSLNVSTWSGTPYYMTKALQSKFPDLFPVRKPRPLLLQYVRRLTRKATAGRIDIFWNPMLAKRNAGQLANRLKIERIDVALCIGNSPLSAYLAQQFSTIHVSDTTVPLMLDYYSEFSRLPKKIAANAWQLDSASVLQSRASLFATEWAANSAIRDYGADPSRIHVIPWGANIEGRDDSEYESAFRADVCHLVFIGVDWQRKGGDIAVAAAMRLIDAGYAVKLHIIGATPHLTTKSDAVILHGFLNKGTKEGRDMFNSIMTQAAFLFVPTREDCFGMVFPEANSYGVPVITTRTGGVPGAVVEGVNGHMLPIEATADEYAKLIWDIWSNRDTYYRLRDSSRRQFVGTLNWGTWLAQATKVIERVASQPS